MTLLSQPTEPVKVEPTVEVVAPPPVTTQVNTQAVTDTYEATAYIALCDTGCSGVTYTGHDARQSIYTSEGHRVIAVDPSVIPLYSIVAITLTDGTTFTAQALDIGSAINGHDIDLLVASESEAWQFGRQSVEIEYIRKGSD